MKKYLGEGLLIVFSVLFALFINSLAQKYQTSQKVKVAKESLLKEMEQNQVIMTQWKEKHSKILKHIDEIIKNDSLQEELIKDHFLDIGALTGQENLISSLVTSTAWETAQATQILSELDFDTTQELTYVYELQNSIINSTLPDLVDIYFQRETHRKESLLPTLIQFKLHFNEIVGQETLLVTLYPGAIEKLQD
ncbi:hypothetical protein [Fulvivirga ligni]|uniref:hypothetical protein n=1 Tax=Fulvivirga ligni TaxID=2904246 RepID=UPI001F3DEECA|nr:hypothetical protein [Fulvivirga ligni]UII24083.1 hypothetical protein LVD16_12725 [Fulvivirga ligni]